MNQQTKTSWTEDEILQSVYRVAPKVYRLKDWSFTDYQEDDFVQDAAMKVLDLHNQGDYLRYKPTSNLDGLIYTLLSGYFVKNAHKKRYKDAKVKYISGKDSEDSKGNYDSRNYSLDIESNEDDPSTSHRKKEDLELGKVLLDEILDNLSFTPYKTNKHKYDATEKTLGDFKLSEYNIAKLLTLGYNLSTILELFGFGKGERNSQTSFITHKVKDTLDKLKDIIDGLEVEDKKAIESYILSI